MGDTNQVVESLVPSASPLTGSFESGWRDSNPRPLRPERSALPSCATPRLKPRQRIASARELAKPQCSTSPRYHQGVTEPNETSVRTRLALWQGRLDRVPGR